MKCLVRNKIGGKNFGFITPATAEVTKAFCDTHLDGTYVIYESTAKVGNPVEAEVLNVTITGKSQSGTKSSFSFYAKSTKTEDEIRAALLGKTFNNVKFDEIYIINMNKEKFNA